MVLVLPVLLTLVYKRYRLLTRRRQVRHRLYKLQKRLVLRQLLQLLIHRILPRLFN